MSCNCIDRVNSKLTNGMRLEVTCGMSGTSWPYISASNEMTRKKGQKKTILTIIPEYCPFCGERYGKDGITK